MKELKNNGEKIKIIDIFSEKSNILSERVYSFSPDIKQTIDSLTNELELSLDFPYSVFLSGSYAFSSRSSTFVDIKTTSDIDIWVIVSDLEPKAKSKQNLYFEALYGLNDFDMFMHKFDFDKRFSIKFIKERTLRDLFICNKNALLVKRQQSLLTKKKENIFCGLTSKKSVQIKESLVYEGYIWVWELLFFNKRDEFILSDLISFFMIGFFIKDDLSLSSLQNNFIEKLDSVISGLTATEFENLFGYFSRSLPNSFEKILTQFWNK